MEINVGDPHVANNNTVKLVCRGGIRMVLHHGLRGRVGWIVSRRVVRHKRRHKVVKRLVRWNEWRMGMSRRWWR